MPIISSHNFSMSINANQWRSLQITAGSRIFGLALIDIDPHWSDFVRKKSKIITRGNAQLIYKIIRNSFCVHFFHSSLWDTAVCWGPFISHWATKYLIGLSWEICLKLGPDYHAECSWYPDLIYDYQQILKSRFFAFWIRIVIFNIQ